METIILNQQFDEERALYNLQNAKVCDCIFAGEADGESALKESRNVNISGCRFSLRYPLWHTVNFDMKDSVMEETARAAIWYAREGRIEDSVLGGIKALRECSNIDILRSKIISQEFGWKSKGISLSETMVEAEYLFLDAENVRLDRVDMKGKYSFQYVDGLTIANSRLDTKDAFWHAHNVYVKNSLVRGEYLGWFSDGLTLENCRIIGTQPLCYCTNLKLIDCTMEDTDLCFEYSDVEADIRGHVDSIKNPRSGLIVCNSVGEIVTSDPVMECGGRVEIRK